MATVTILIEGDDVLRSFEVEVEIEATDNDEAVLVKTLEALRD